MVWPSLWNVLPGVPGWPQLEGSLPAPRAVSAQQSMAEHMDPQQDALEGGKMGSQIISDGSPTWNTAPDGNSGMGEQRQRCGMPGRAGPWVGAQPELQEAPKELPDHL